MSNLYQIKKKLDDLLKDKYGSDFVNNVDFVATDDNTNYILIETRLGDLNESDQRDSLFLSLDVPYQIRYTRANDDINEVETRHEQCAIDYQDIVKCIMDGINTAGIENVKYSTGFFDFITQNDYQSYGEMEFMINHSFRNIG